MVKVDETDLRIIKILKQNGRRHTSSVAEELGLSEGAVRKRVNTMIDNGTIRQFTIKLGKTKAISALIYVALKNNNNFSLIIDELKKMTEVLLVFETTGRNDLVIQGAFLNIEHFNNFVDNLKAMDNVADTKSRLIVGEH